MAGNDDKPLITPQSPSFDRAQREAGSPVPPDAHVVGILNGLVEAEHDAERACRAGMHAAKDRGLLLRLRLQAADHTAHAQALEEMVRALGGSAPRAEESRAVLTAGARQVEGAGSDEAILETLKAMEGEMRTLYQNALADPHVGPVHREALQRLAPTG